MINNTFINHPFIQSISEKPRWTISTQNKKPVDMTKLIYEDRIIGANFADPKSLTKLSEVVGFFNKHNMTLTNCCFYLYSMLDNVVVLDVEKYCSDELKKKFLQTPYLYGEYSMSGKGYHLVYPVPDWLSSYPAAEKKSVIRNEDHGYEILMAHYCTFTGNILPPCEHPTDFFDTVFKNLAVKQKEIIRAGVITGEPDVPDIPEITRKRMLDILTNTGKEYAKKPEDFRKRDGTLNPSGYEFALAGYLYWKYKNMIKSGGAKNINHTFTDNDAAWFVYNALKNNVPHRDKHDTLRSDMPYLLYSVWRLIDMNTERT